MRPTQTRNIYHPFRGSGNSTEVRDISKAIADPSKWGALNEFHWWSKPEDGYYCLSNNDTLLAKHAEMLRDAGIDFIFYDATNEADFTSGSSLAQSFDRLLTVWRDIDGAPKVVPWVPLTANGTMVTHLLNKLNEPANQEMRFLYDDNKPLVIGVGWTWESNGQTHFDGPPAFLPDPGRINQLSASYTIRLMWALPDPSLPTHLWSFMSKCGSTFKASGGAEACGQRVSYRPNNTLEQVPVTTAYQDFQLMTDTANAVPKFRGRTFWQQFKRAHDLAPPLVMLTGWNEWMAQRGCRSSSQPYSYAGGSGPTTCPGNHHETMPDGKKVFADQYDVEYNRDIEPAETAASMGRYYYDVMKTCVLAYKTSPHTLCTSPSSPIGVFDAVTQTAVDGVVGGWAFDPNSPNAEISVHVYFFPPAGSPTVVGTTTTGFRGDVNAAYGISGNHGFTIPVPKSLYNGTTYTVRVYGIDAQDPSGNSNAEVTPSRTFNYTNQVPNGHQDGYLADGTVWGWAYDPNHPAEALTIHVQYWNPTTWTLVTTKEVSTTDYRPDVNSAFGISGNHGFRARHCNGQQLYAVSYAMDRNNSGMTQITTTGHYVPACSP